jgi:hypothetical protein
LGVDSAALLLIDCSAILHQGLVKA